MDFSKTRKSPILLQEISRKYALDPRRPIRGFVKLENNADKGLVTVIVENVKIFPAGEYCYKLLLAGIKKEQQVYHLLGSIVLSAGGRGEGTFRIRPADLNGRGSCLWEFNTMIVAASSVTNPRESLHPVLQGKFRIACPADPLPTAAPKDYSPFYQDFVLDRCITIARMQKQLTDIRPFYHDSTSAHWKKVLDWSDFPILSPGSETPVKIYGHFLWGWNDTHYFVAVPGRFLPAEQPDSGRSGFTFWQPILGMEKIQQDTSLPLQQRRDQTYGYWIASISRRTGKIEEYPYRAVTSGCPGTIL